MLTLGIETSVRAGSVALCRDGQCLTERPLDSHGSPPRRRRHAQALVAEIVERFRQCGRKPSDCDAVAVSLGPGSFTGLRVGVVCAKTLAYATGCSLAGIDTFLAIAENTPAEIQSVFVIGDAQRGDLAVGRYIRRPDGWFERDGAVRIVHAEDWCRDRRPTDLISGPGLDKVADRLTGRCRILGPEFRTPRAHIVARLGERAVQAGRADDPWTLEPFYLRKSAAEERREKTGVDRDEDQRAV